MYLLCTINVIMLLKNHKNVINGHVIKVNPFYLHVSRASTLFVYIYIRGEDVEAEAKSCCAAAGADVGWQRR